MANASSYEEWVSAAERLDVETGREAWKRQRDSRFYASRLLASTEAELRRAVAAKDTRRVLQVMQQCLRDANYGGHLTEDLYSKSYCGTKHQVETYCSTVVDAMEFVRKVILKEIDMPEDSCTSSSAGDRHPAAPGGLVLGPAVAWAAGPAGAAGSAGPAGPACAYEQLLLEARHFTEFAVCTFGRTALCLSGGGAMALQHFGVVDELFRRGLLPRVICGTSGGAVVACYVCSRTDAELRGEVPQGLHPLALNPEAIQPFADVFEGTWLARICHWMWHGCFFSQITWLERSVSMTLGDTTFLEAFLRTGRVLNVTTCIKAKPGEAQQAPVLLNYQTHPHVLLRSAFCCSAAMPNLSEPAKLLEKDPVTGEIRLHSETELCYADGTIDADIPSLSLAQTFGVRYTIAVQVNPHVSPFLHASRGEAGSPISWRRGSGRWRGGFILCAIEILLRECLRTLWRLMALLELLPRIFGTKWDLFLVQNFEGSVTLTNNNAYLWKVCHALENPSPDDLRWWWREGKVMLWQKMSLLEKRLLPERALAQLEETVEDALQRCQAEGTQVLPGLAFPDGSTERGMCSSRDSLVRSPRSVFSPTSLPVPRKRSSCTQASSSSLVPDQEEDTESN